MLCEFEYTDEDARLKRLPAHRIPINTTGQSIYISYAEGTRDYRSRIRKYVEFRNGVAATMRILEHSSGKKQLTANEIVWARELIKVAEKQPPYIDGVIEYGKLDDVTKTELKYAARPFNEVSGEMLGNISIFCNSMGLPLISVIVISADNNKKEPSHGFYSLMLNLGKIKKIPTSDFDRIGIYVPEMKKVHDSREWSRLETALDSMIGNVVHRNSQSILTDEEKKEVERIESSLPTTPTEREQIVQVRLQQGLFRERIIAKYNGKCVITGISSSKILIAGHIKPWAKSNAAERLDKENGLLLSATYDKLFDKGYISFEIDGTIIISKKLSADDIVILQIREGQRYNIKPSDRMKEYLDYHRKEIYLK